MKGTYNNSGLKNNDKKELHFSSQQQQFPHMPDQSQNSLYNDNILFSQNDEDDELKNKTLNKISSEQKFKTGAFFHNNLIQLNDKKIKYLSILILIIFTSLVCYCYYSYSIMLSTSQNIKNHIKTITLNKQNILIEQQKLLKQNTSLKKSLNNVNNLIKISQLENKIKQKQKDQENQNIVKQQQRKNYRLEKQIKDLEKISIENDNKIKQMKQQLKKNSDYIKKLQTINQDFLLQQPVIQSKQKTNTDKNQENSALGEQKKAFKIRQKFRDNTPLVLQKRDRYDLVVSVEQLIFNSQMYVAYPNNRVEWSGIRKNQYKRAIRLMEVVHNVNFKGEFVLDHFKFYSSAQQKYQALSSLLAEQKKYYDQKYETSRFTKNQIGFCVCVCSYNNAVNRLYLRNLDSIFQQQYRNYHVVYINDASDDGTGDYVKKYMIQNEIPLDKLTIVNNEKRQGIMANLYTAGHKHCNPGQIMTFIDGDDSLIGRQVFSVFNTIYQTQKIGFLYSQYFQVTENKIKNGVSKYISNKNLQEGTYRKLKNLYSIHLNTMYVDIFRKIDVKDFQYSNGTFFDYASDTAYTTPAIQLVGTRVKHLPEIMYEYRHDATVHDDYAHQKPIMQDIFNRQPYKALNQMPFADNPLTIQY